MDITYSQSSQIFRLETANSTYVMTIGVTGELRHAYYGASVPSDDAIADLAVRTRRRSFSPGDEEYGEPSALNQYPLEISGFGGGDYRLTMLQLRDDATGCAVSRLKYVSHRIVDGKPELPGLPSSFAGESAAKTLQITMQDVFSGVEVVLSYSVFADSDVIARSVRIVNTTDHSITLARALSAQLDFHDSDYDMVYCEGVYGVERHGARAPLRPGIQGFGSIRGASGHQYTPAVALAARGATERQGEVYSMILVYSGNYLVQAEVDELYATRLSTGINPDSFSWHLASGEEFQTPEVLLAFSAHGIGGMSCQNHDFLTRHLIRPVWAQRRRPILINNWEATYFNFDEPKLVALAKKAASLGIEMLVLDDGWFGKRNNDFSSLGDWFVNAEKLPDFAGMVRKVNAEGLKFGLWFEPEMVSPDSNLYRAHPEWALCVAGKPRCLGRNQLVLDFSRPEVVDCIYGMMEKLLSEVNIEYIKWDMNRNLTEVFSAALPPERQGEVFHRYVLGVYELAARLLKRFPKLLMEGCSGGGGRFDAGMLYYFPQIWCSDDTDAPQRVGIQTGTSIFYPCTSIGAHVSVCPNHQTDRIVSWQFRADVAAAGTFGYELDITKFTPEEDEIVRKQVEQQKEDGEIIRSGSFYRLVEGFGLTPLTVWCWVARDAASALAIIVRSTARICGYNPVTRLRFVGLEPAAEYLIAETGQRFHGATLMNAGVDVTAMTLKETTSTRLHLRRL